VSPTPPFAGSPHDCVWEVTLACDARCVHCGSDAGRARARELDTAEALDVCDQLAALGTREVTLSGGEPLLREDWPRLARRLVERGVRVSMISNGLGWDAVAVRAAVAAGLHAVTLSIDGPADLHDELRGVPGAFPRALAAVRALREAGLPVGVSTQVSRPALPRLVELERALAAAGVRGWQLQLTMPAGRCAERRELVPAADELPELVRFVLAARARGALPLYLADNVGWMTPDEPLLRSAARPPDRFFAGCQAGLGVLGLTSDGTVRGCLSLPPEFDEGNLRQRSLASIWHDPAAFPYNRRFREDELTGACARCPFARVCRGGCRSVAWATGRTVHENGYCLRLR
jgi:radical SAM protein with 4Fe4S-binding SPASM domain